MPRFEMPWVLSALLLLPLLWLRLRKSRAGAVRLPFAESAVAFRQSTRARWVNLPRDLRLAALAFLICAAAGPRTGPRLARRPSQTIGIQLLVDCSGSMQEKDMLFRGKLRSRIDLVRELSQDFVFGNGADLQGRPFDTIGVIAFAEYPTTLSPLVADTESLHRVLDGIRVGNGSDGTAIGDAVAVAAARFHQADADPQDRFKSKAIVLLTDGENNSGRHSVAEATALAKEWGVRIYAIGIRQRGRRANGADDPAWDDLERMAVMTGGIVRLVTDGASLRAVYTEIDKLEKTERAAPRFTGGWEWIYALGATGLALLLAEILLGQTWLRRIP